MKKEEFYGATYAALLDTESRILDIIAHFPEPDSDDLKHIIYCRSRIKEPDSMIRKLEKNGLEPTRDNALTQVSDAVGVRIVCAFVDDVYRVANWLQRQPSLLTIRTKDYISYPKPNGYRSLHLILRFLDGMEAGLDVEVQLRTMAIDCWATIEHQLKYKHDVPDENMIRKELKRCADEIASVDLSMQTLRDILRLPDALRKENFTP